LAWQQGADPFSRDCRLEGGGDFPEKMARFRTLRRVALEHQAGVGVEDEATVKRDLIERTWFPVMEVTEENTAAEAARHWRIPSSNFPALPAGEQVGWNPEIFAELNVRRPAANQRNYAPEITGEIGNNVYTLEGNVPLITFKHRQPKPNTPPNTPANTPANPPVNNSINIRKHANISKEGLVAFIERAVTMFAEPEYDFGKCFYQPDCKALLYPEEIKPFLVSDPAAAADAAAAAATAAGQDETAVAAAAAAAAAKATKDSKLYDNYRRLFNMKFAELPENNEPIAAAPAAAAVAGAAGAAGVGAAAAGNARRRRQTGGGRNDYFQPATTATATCALPLNAEGKGCKTCKRSTRKARKALRKTRRHRRSNRR
jgi:hypothetical protein